MEKEQVKPEEKGSHERKIRELTLKLNYFKLDEIHSQLCDVLSPENEFEWGIAKSIGCALTSLDVLVSELEDPGDE